MGATSRIRTYYDALRDGDPLYPYFVPDADEVVKAGISERLVGYDEIEEGLREQSHRTTDWAVESRDLRVTERDRHAWFADLVSMGWTDTDDRIRYEFETRWSGTLEREQRGASEASGAKRRAGSGASREQRGPGEGDGAPGDWRFVGVHVSTEGDL